MAVASRAPDLAEALRNLGSAIREWRTARRLTLGQVARRTGVSASMISLVERGIANPSIGTLIAIADALEIPVSELFGHGGVWRYDPVVRREAQPVFETRPGVRRRLAVRDPVVDVELAENSYEPGESSADSPIKHRGRELGVVLQGRLRVQLGDQSFVLREGDAIAFSSTVPHRFTNVGRGAARTIWVNLHGTREDTLARISGGPAGRKRYTRERNR
ncbi:MAG: XRE family transcriptional regulator [Armatimonadota bacterium]|nr:XRE family transcriptional regulator [Armatimonadota bacterium]MDR5698189.1 XRE family transcriptional regulator [Armatimonadota bacterium]